jgi:hypothetical protein
MVFRKDENGNRVATKELFVTSKEGVDGKHDERTIYEKWWFWVVIAIVLALAAAAYVYRDKLKAISS